MRRGCIVLGEMRCDDCHRVIRHSERYLAVEEENGVESDTGQTVHYCMDCALKKGYAYYREEKNDRILSIFPKV